MKLTRHHPVANSIVGHSAAGVNISGRLYSDSLIVSAADIVVPWTHAALADMRISDLRPALAMQPELILLGCGDRQGQAPTAILAELAAAGVGLEVMTTDAVCRTYNVLTSESRNVVAALMLTLPR
ncbi:MAG: MTH938/NDUFAF3 family protein [Pseudomonadota bacterium]